MTDAPTLFTDVARRLMERRWRPIPLRADTKVPAMLGWNRYNTEPLGYPELGRAEWAFADAACGIAVPSSLVAVDIDILDELDAEAVAGVARHMLGETPLVRIGLAPKRVLIYRSNSTARSQKPHPLEIFSGTGQVAVFGFHQKAGRPYQWPDASPLDMDADDTMIPLVTGAQVDEFVQKVSPVLLRHRAARGTARQSSSGSSGLTWFDRWRELVPLGWMRATATLATEALNEGIGRHDAVWCLINKARVHGKDPDEVIDLLRVVAPGLLAHVDADDDYTARVIARVYGGSGDETPVWITR